MGNYVSGDTLGSAASNALIAAGANAVIPGSGSIVGGALSLFSMFGTSDEDKRRMARVQYFYNLAAAGNVGAAQVMLGALYDVSENEEQYWQHALQQLAGINPAVSSAAQTAGAKRFTGTGDTPENYPHMQAYALNWGASYAPVTSTPISSPVSSSGYTPAPRSQALPTMTTTAPYNWLPVVAGVGATAIVAAIALSRGRRR